MRKPAWAVAAVAGLLLAMGLVLWERWRPEPSSIPARDSSSVPAMSRMRPRGAPTPPPSGSLSIRGTVRDEQGPAAGVRVSATRPMPGETISELPCSELTKGAERSGRSDRRLPECMEEARALVLELVGARYGEAPVYAETVTAEDGSFVLDGLPEGAFTLWALGERGVQLRPGVTAGSEGVALKLEEGQVLEGIVVDSNERPLPEARVTLLHVRHTRFFDARSDEEGRFRVGPLPRGGYGLVAEKEGWLPEYLPPLMLGTRKARVILFPPGRLVGRVLAAGAPVAGAEVRVDDAFSLDRGMRTDAQGRFVFEGMWPGVYELAAEREGQHAVAKAELNLPGAPSEEVVLHLGSARYVEGTVWDDARRPVEGASVSVWHEARQVKSPKTGPDGRYRLGPLEVGAYRFEVSAPRYLDVSGEPRKLERDSGPMDFTLVRAVSIVGMVVDEEGAPVAGAWLEVTGPDNGGEPLSEGGGTTSGEDGRFQLDLPRAGSWNVSLEHERFLTEERAVSAPAEEVRWVLLRGASVEGTVTDEQGAPVFRAAVVLWRPGEEWSVARAALTDEQGRFSVGGLEAGRYVLEASLEREGVERLASKPVALRDSGAVEVSLRFEAGWSFSGVAVDEEGRPLSGVAIRTGLLEKSTPAWRKRAVSCVNGLSDVLTGSDGRFTVRHLTADVYSLNAYKEDYTHVPSQAVGARPLDEHSLQVREGTQEVRLVFDRNAHITGRLIGPEGVPLRHFTVSGRPVNDASGAFAYPFDASGEQSLYFHAPGMAQVMRRVEVRAGVDVDIGEVRVGPGRRVEGRVLDAETGEPVAGAFIRIKEPPPGAPAKLGELVSTQTREDGSFELPHVEAKPLLLEVFHPAFRGQQQQLGAGEESLTLRLEPGAVVELSIRDHQGRPMDAWVEFSREDDGRREGLPVQGANFIKRGLEPGTWLAHARVIEEPTRVFLPQRVNIPASGRVALTFVERSEGATLTVRMQAPEALADAVLLAAPVPAPLSLGSILFWRSSGLLPERQEGRLTFRHLPPGRAVLLLVLDDSPLRVHLEELDIPAGGVVDREVHPRWQSPPMEE